MVHSLVALAFIGPRPEGMEVNHKDCDKQNNALNNLEYVTHGENQRHAAQMGRMSNDNWTRREMLYRTNSTHPKLALSLTPSPETCFK